MERRGYVDRPDDETTFSPKAPGSFQRGPNNLQNWIAPGGDYPPTSGRYHIFVNYGCGWCHQAMLTRAIKGLENVVSISHTGLNTVGKRGTESYVGWNIPEDGTGNGFTSAYDVYNAATDYGRKQLTTPMLFDKESKKVISNDPAQMLLMLNGEFSQWAEHGIDLYPGALQEEIEKVNAIIFPGINDGVYRCWFCGPPDKPFEEGGTNEAFEEGYNGVQNAFKWVEERLQDKPYLCGAAITLADIRAFPHLFRFDVIYHKLMLRGRGSYLKDAFPNIVSWLERMFSDPRVRSTCDLAVAARFYLSEPDSDCDALYTALKFPWMPSIEELEAKRTAEALPALSASCPRKTAGAPPGPNSS